MTQSLEFVHRKPLCHSQTVIAAKLDEPAERSDLRLCDTFDSTRQTLLHLHERVVLYITILSRLKDDLHKDQRAKRNARLTLKKQQVTFDKLNFLRREKKPNIGSRGRPEDQRQENHLQTYRVSKKH